MKPIIPLHFDAVVTIVGIAVTLLIALYYLEMQRRAQRREKRRNGLRAVEQGIALMTVFQQHRGISAALLNGDQSFAAKQTAKQAEIDATLSALSQMVARTPALASSQDSLKQLGEGWQKLRAQVRGLSPAQSFVEHTELVRSILYFIGDVGERAGLLESRDTRLVRLLETLLLRLPLLVETVGQARAMGTGFAARGQCGAVGRIRLTFLGRRIDHCLSELDPALAEIGKDSQGKVRALLELLTKRIIAAERIDIAPERYYQASTEAIDACLVLWRKAATMADIQLQTAS